MTPKQLEEYKKIIKNFKPPEGYWEDVAKRSKEFDEYMELPTHLSDCYCYRCMSEFNEYLRNKDNGK